MQSKLFVCGIPLLGLWVSRWMRDTSLYFLISFLFLISYHHVNISFRGLLDAGRGIFTSQPRQCSLLCTLFLLDVLLTLIVQQVAFWASSHFVACSLSFF
jgi:hypothetical protein